MIWIYSLYSHPKAQVKIEGTLFPPFVLKNGKCQGCPLSTLLFILSLELLLRTVKAHPSIHGIDVGDKEYRLAAFVDDLLFFITQPLVSMPNLMDILDVYGQLSILRLISLSHRY